jgi:UDP-glucose 4-epimerase
VFGDDYPTKDGTGVRDYIHVVDLVSGHIKALSKISESSGIHIWNLGRGEGYSVIDVIQTFELVTGKSIPYEIRDRRLGDIAECWADVAKARTDLNWQAELDLEAILEDTWRWIVKNPNGYTQ